MNCSFDAVNCNTHTHTHIYTHTHTHTHTYTYIYIYINKCIHVNIIRGSYIKKKTVLKVIVSIESVLYVKCVCACVRICSRAGVCACVCVGISVCERVCVICKENPCDVMAQSLDCSLEVRGAYDKFPDFFCTGI